MNFATEKNGKAKIWTKQGNIECFILSISSNARI